MFGAFRLMLDEPPGSGQPAACLRQLPFEQQREPDPEQAPRRPASVPALPVRALGLLQHPTASVRVSEQVRGAGQLLKIVAGQRRRVLGVVVARHAASVPCQPGGVPDEAAK